MKIITTASATNFLITSVLVLAFLNPALADDAESMTDKHAQAIFDAAMEERDRIE